MARVVIVGFCLAICLLAAATAAPDAAASPLQQDRAKAQELAAEVAALDARIDAAVLRYSRATEALSMVRTAICQNRRQQRMMRYELDLARGMLTARAVTLYKCEEATPFDVVFGAEDFSELVAQLTMMRRVEQTDRDIVQTIAQTSQELEDRAEALDADSATAERLVAQRGEEYTSIRDQLGRRRALLAGVQAKIRTFVRQQATAVVELEPAVKPPADSSGGSGRWWPLIQQAAGANGVSARGMYRLMMIESGGSATIVGPGGYHGLFQYAPSTWKGSWNPYRHCSITDGAAQIRATALALRLGYGPRWWVNTYPWAFGNR